ncbi:hypothetical protein [Phaeocystidibacter marisrubri]|uniref:hypothetical protein n=2 Tax=Phaeocystidibacter marisrubri TaxID=1577780 RepID=UPI001668467B|nr:hypothetical protein [Phaeocystidibacter marisrubri]GGH78033.1 hypothetical protein GCM10011318_28700 [Phaeocystidibacter marisrubri]
MQQNAAINPVFFRLGQEVNSPNSSRSMGDAPQIVERPYIDFQAQRELFELWIEQYNAKANALRKQRRKKGEAIDIPECQTIKQSQKQFMFEVIRQVIDQVVSDSKLLRSIGGHILRPDEPFSLYTNNVKLSKRLGNSTRAVRYQVERAFVTGFLIGKAYHGTKCDYELQINPRFLLFFDLKNPDQLPSTSLLGTTREWGFPPHLRKKLPLSQKERTERTSTNKLTSKRTDEREELVGSKQSKESSSESLSREDKRKNTEKRVKTLDDRRKEICPHPALFDPSPSKEHQTRGARPKLETEIRPLVLNFLWSAHSKLWEGRLIYEAEYRRTFEHIVEHYFQNVTTIKGARAQIARLERIIAWQEKFVAIDPENRYTKYPSQFFDWNCVPNEGDYSTARGIGKLLQEKDRKRSLSKAQRTTRNKTRLFRLEAKKWLLDPTDKGYKELLKKTQRLWPEFIPELLQYKSERLADVN